MPYQLILLGPLAPRKGPALQTEFDGRVTDLGLTPGVDTEVLISPSTAAIDWAGAPVAAWLGAPSTTNSPAELAILDKLLAMSAPVFPVVEDNGAYLASVPAPLYAINGAQWLTQELPALVADLLRAMRLTREQRRAFISYRRNRTLGVARQLFTELGLRGYLPFLDTASVPLAVDFQETLWSRMVNVDLVILLDAPNSLDSTWVHQELNRAHALSLGVLQLIWPDPNFNGSPGTEFCDPFKLTTSHFVNGTSAAPTDHLVEPAVADIVTKAEQTRIRSINQRRKSVIGEVMDQATRLGFSIKLYPQDAAKHPAGAIRLSRRTGGESWVVPLVGLPDAVAVQDQEVLLTPSSDWTRTRMVFNGLGISKRDARHISWLNERERLVAAQVDDIGSWLVRL